MRQADLNVRRASADLELHALDRLPDQEVADQPFEFPPLKGKPGTERYSGPVKPIAGKFR